MAVISGITATLVNGVAYDCEQEASYTSATTTQEIVKNWSGRNLLISTPVPAKITLKLITDGTFLVGQVFGGLNGATVTIIKSTNEQIIMSDAYVTTPPNVSVRDSTFEVEFESYTVTEIPAQ